MRVATGQVDQPLPPDMLRPLTEPFTIIPSKDGAHARKVGVILPGPLPRFASAQLLVMLIGDGAGGWQMLSTDYDPSTRTVTARG